MQVEPEISLKGVGGAEIKDTIAELCGKLEAVCDHIIACRIAVERPNRSVQSGSGFRVRVEVSVPPRHKLVVTSEVGDGEQHRDLEAEVHAVFDAMARRLRDLNQQQHAKVKRHNQQEVAGWIERLHDGYGFIRTPDQREIYFHRNSVLAPDFEHLHQGDGVAFSEELGDEGPQASSLRVVQRAPA